MALWICRCTQNNRKSGRGENKWDQDSHHCWFKKVCLIIWVAQASDSWLRTNLWTWNGSSTRETNAFHKIPHAKRVGKKACTFLLRQKPASFIDIHPTCIIWRGSIQKIWGPPTTSRVNECNALFPGNEEGGVNVKRGVYETNNQPKIQHLSMIKREDFVLV